MQFSFGDRFSYNNPTFAALENAGIETATDQQLISASPQLAEVARMVRRFSVLLKNTAAKEIYYAVTDHADPEIALILSTAKNGDGSWRYPTANDVKKFLFSPPSGNLVEESRNKFAEGIRRISAAYAAAELISAFATLSEQLTHAEALKTRATKELEMLLSVVDKPVETVTQKEEFSKGHIYFERKTFTTTSSLYVYVDLPGTAISLSPIVYLAGSLSTAQIVHDIADKINEASLSSTEVNLLAAPILAGPNSTHYIELNPRLAVPDRTAYLVTIHFKSDTQNDYDTIALPFNWGVEVAELSSFPLNSVLLLVLSDYFVATKVGGTTEQTDNSKLTPTILYIKKDRLVTAPSTAQYSLRFPVTLDDPISVTFTRSTGTNQTLLDNERFSQFALSLVNTIAANKNDTAVIAAIVRNDPATLADPVAVVELFAWSVTNPEVTLTVDILSLPADILISLGDYTGPYSLYSNKPRSIRIQSIYKLNAQVVTTANELELTGTPKMVGYSRSKLLDNINDANSAFERLHEPLYFY